jgi:hypothetical protein
MKLLSHSSDPWIATKLVRTDFSQRLEALQERSVTAVSGSVARASFSQKDENEV